MTPEEKRVFELSVAQALNEARALGLTDLRNSDVDPPDVRGRIGNRRIGIEVTEPKEGKDADSVARLKKVVLPAVERRAVAAAPGEAWFDTNNLALSHLKARQLQQLADQLATVVLRLAAVAVEPGSEACAANGPMRQVLSRKPGRWNLQGEITLPLGFQCVRYERLKEGTVFRALRGGGNGGPFAGAGLETTAERIEEKKADLTRWPAGYDERWLVVASLSDSRTSVQQVRLDLQRFPGTGFDKIWMIDALHPLSDSGKNLPVNACRLDIHEEP